jgi:hypothetical protein
MMNASATAQRINRAAQLVSQLVVAAPHDTTLPIILKQLHFLQEVYERDQSFLAVPSSRVTLGVIAAKEDYDTIHPELAGLLHEISYAIKHQAG